MIDKKKLFKSLLIILLIIIIIIAAIQIRNTLARYETTTTAERDVDLAFWILDNSAEEQRLLIKDIYPTDSQTYTFSISNYEGSRIAETDIEYDLILTTTTNLPLTYEITRMVNGTTKTETLNQELVTDDNGTVYRKMSFATDTDQYPLKMDTIDNTTYTKSKITDTYTLKVTFPQKSYVNGVEVDNRENLEYPDLMEDIKIELSARQKIN